MKLSSKEIAKRLLLQGRHLNKAQFHNDYHTFTLTQRIEEIRNEEGWAIKSKVIPNMNGMVEYWLEPEEIERLKRLLGLEKGENEQQVTEATKTSVKAENKPEIEHYEQMGLGLLGGRNWK